MKGIPFFYINFTLNHSPGSMDSTGKEKESKTGARAATAGPRRSCQRDSSCSLQTVAFAMIPARMEMNRGVGANQNRTGLVNRGSGHGMAKVTAGKQSLLSKATAGEHSRRMIRPAQASQQNNSQQMLAGLSPCSAGWWRECGGAGHSRGGLRPTLPVSLPPIAFACHCTYPLP